LSIVFYHTCHPYEKERNLPTMKFLWCYVGALALFLVVCEAHKQHSVLARDRFGDDRRDEGVKFHWLSIVVAVTLVLCVLGCIYHSTIYWYATPSEVKSAAERSSGRTQRTQPPTMASASMIGRKHVVIEDLPSRSTKKHNKKNVEDDTLNKREIARGLGIDYGDSSSSETD
jgi:hypothetical protein